MLVAPLIVSGGVVGPVEKQTSPLMMVCGEVLEFVKVSETTPYVLVVARGGAVAAAATSLSARPRSATTANIPA